MTLTRSQDLGESSAKGVKVVLVSLVLNVFLAIIKIASGIFGNSYALVADGIESMTDVLSTTIVWGGLKIAAIPPDANHPYGHGKAEPLAATVVALALVGAAVVIAIQSIKEILTPHHAPASFTLIVLLAVILTKELLFRFAFKIGEAIQSTAVKVDAWHQRSDAITSTAAFVGITVALIGGEGYESADDWAALAACLVIGYNGLRLLRYAIAEIMDAAPNPEVEQQIRRKAQAVNGVIDVEKCRVRKSGLGFFVDIHVIVAGDISVRKGHEISHVVKDRLCNSGLQIIDVIVHFEPADIVESIEDQ